MPRQRVTILKSMPDHALADALARMPIDQFVIWNGRPCPGQPGSIRSQSLQLVDEIWTPVSLRVLIQRAARLSGLYGLDPDAVRSAVRMHQASGSASYFLTRRTALGDYVAVADVPNPSGCEGRLCPGDVILSRMGGRFGTSEAATSIPFLFGGGCQG